MKKILIGIGIIIVLGAAVVAWMVFGSATAFSEKKRTLYISSVAATKEAVLDSLEKNKIIKNRTAFERMAARMDYWQSIRPGKYDIKKGTSLLHLIRLLRNGQQSPVNLVITKIRTKEDFARLAANKFEFDSTQMLQYLNNHDSLQQHGVDPEVAMTMILPDTYTFFWNTTPAKVYTKLAEESKKFWTEERKAKAQQHGLTPEQAYILASVVEEETNASSEKGNIASVYMNRINKGMPLQADPTVKFALKDFGLKRIYQKHTQTASPYNTYQNTGLPPGPICTPSKATINAVLDAPATDYLYFVASSNFNGTHVFTTNYADHLIKAREYQQALDALLARKKTQTTP